MPRKPVAVIAADVHLHPFSEGNAPTESGAGRRVELTLDALSRVYETARTLGTEVWLAGDLLHDKSSIPVHVVKPLLSLLGNYGEVTTRIITGNHERPDHRSPLSSLDFLTLLRTVHVYTTPQYLQMSAGQYGFDVAFLPWSPDWPAALAELTSLLIARHSPTRPRILIGHGCVDGAMTESGIRLANPQLTHAALNLASYNLSFWGDIHGHQPIATNAWYVGALCPQNYGERTLVSGFVVVYDDMTWERRTIDAGPRFKYHDDTIAFPAEATVFTKASPASIAQAVLAAESTGTAYPDLTSLEALFASYQAANPLPDGVTAAEVFTTLTKLLTP